MARKRREMRMDPDGSTDGPVNGSHDMDLYTAHLMADERMRDRERDFEASQLAALARVRPEPDDTNRLRDGVRRTAGWFRILRRGHAT
jgi:hypothetical protein